jgi:arylformamidase
MIKYNKIPIKGAFMKIYDISQEVFGCCVYPGDPVPKKEIVLSIKNGDVCNLTSISMCAHNGTHIDAPNHFIDDGKTVDRMDLSRLVGYAYVCECNGILTSYGANRILEKAKNDYTDSYKRILLKGNVEVSYEAAEVFANEGIFLLGNESQTVGPTDAPMAVHKLLLGKEIALLEGIRLGDVEEGVYFLCAAPLNLGGADGSPCRAILINMND